MKKNSIIKILTGTLCLAMMMSITTVAFATEASNVAKSEGIPAVKTEEAQFVGEYRTEEGTISSVEARDGNYIIEISNDNMGVIFNTKEDAFVFEQSTGKVISVKELKKGMNLVAIMPVHTPMTMSLPPQISGVTAFVIKSDDAFIDVSLYNDELTNSKNTLKLNISDTTKIIDVKGTKKSYNEDEIKGRECVVLYKYTTRSIPAQTNPETVIILDKTETQSAVEKTAKEAATDKDDATQNKYVELRTSVEAKGYKVQWTSNKKPIVLTKDDMSIEITIGSDAFKFTHKTKDIKALDRMEKMDLALILEKGKTMVSSSFIEALE